MQTFTIKCDKCGKKETSTKNLLPEYWVGLNLQQYTCYDAAWYITKHLCPECAKALNVEKTNVSKQKDVSLADRLIDILTEIAQNAQI